ncbi:hypothetical protein [Mycobacterium lepromatosis]|uniref:hypothetical protein n=1 Tax=Mycobacterium lepromatosis TaxID=480418 RepID=UPI0005F80919|nr:hypothetical protein [Mycobacterium lepromatosis]
MAAVRSAAPADAGPATFSSLGASMWNHTVLDCISFYPAVPIGDLAVPEQQIGVIDAAGKV